MINKWPVIVLKTNINMENKLTDHPDLCATKDQSINSQGTST